MVRSDVKHDTSAILQRLHVLNLVACPWVPVLLEDAVGIVGGDGVSMGYQFYGRLVLLAVQQALRGEFVLVVA